MPFSPNGASLRVRQLPRSRRECIPFYRGFLIKVTVNVGLLLCFPNLNSEILTDLVDVSIIDHINLRL